MRPFIVISLLILSNSVLHGQPLLMSHEQNRVWLISLKSKGKAAQWSTIKDRYFQDSSEGKGDTSRNCCMPVLLIDGVPLSITDTLKQDSRKQLMSSLTEDKIKAIAVVDKEPEGVYVNRAFTGMILVTLNDKRTSKKVLKLNLE